MTLTGNGIASSPVIDSEGIIYVGSNDRNLYAIDGNGSLKWSFYTDGPIRTAPAIDNNRTIYVISDLNGGYSRLSAIYPNGSFKLNPFRCIG